MDPSKRTLLQVRAEDTPKPTDVHDAHGDQVEPREVHRRQRARREELDIEPVDSASADPTHPVNIEDEMKRSYMDYAMSVIIGRALPDVRDGLKPANRRVLFAMRQMGSRRTGRIASAPRSSARSSATTIRTATRRRTTRWCASRRTSTCATARRRPGQLRLDRRRSAGGVSLHRSALESLAEAMMADLDKDTVDFRPNFDETTEEPTCLPTPFPNLLVNGSTGIAVGMATSIPPHNMREVIDGVIASSRRRRRRATSGSARCCRPFPARTFPPAAPSSGAEGIYRAYQDGRGGVVVRGKATFEEHKKRRSVSIVVTEIPYQVNKANLISDIASSFATRSIEGISDLRDESEPRRHADRRSSSSAASCPTSC
jgi:DNA gyrase subunit A